jgi:predicted dehydrogenase
MRMNLNQQSIGQDWEWHKTLMRSASPIVDCGVHYVDIMCLVTGAKPIKVHAVGARLTDEIAPDMYNYGQLQVSFDDGSIGWYEAGWGPMISEEAFFVKDIIGPKGCVSIVMGSDEGTRSADMETHTKTSRIRLHHAQLDATGCLMQADRLIDMQDEPGHEELCVREQRYFYDAITQNIDLSEHMADAVNSLRIVLAADRSVRTGQVVPL